MKDNIAELFNITALENENPKRAQAAIKSWDMIMENDNAEIQKRVFLNALGVHKLDEKIQIDMIDKLELVVECALKEKPIPKSLHEFYYGATEPAPVLNETVKADNFKWSKDIGKSQSNVAFMSEKVEPIKKDLFHWGQSSSYGSQQDNLNK
jgi:hypothetical protein